MTLEQQRRSGAELCPTSRESKLLCSQAHRSVTGTWVAGKGPRREGEVQTRRKALFWGSREWISPATPCQAPARPFPKHLWKPRLTLPVSLKLSRETKVESSVSCRRPKRQSALGQDQSVGVSCPSPPLLASPLAASRSAAHGDGKTSFERHSLFPPRLCGSRRFA